MKNPLAGCAIQIPISSTAHLAQRRLECAHKVDSRNNKMNKHGERVDNLALRLREHGKYLLALPTNKG